MLNEPNALHLKNSLDEALLILAIRLNIDDANFLSTAQLEAKVQAISPDVWSRFERFMEAKKDWYEFHQSVINRGSAGKLSADESARQVDVVSKMQDAEIELIAGLEA
jgi:hypothetical protein